MVSPIDYTMNVLNPIEGYMQGLKFGEGLLTARQGRELAQSQESRAQEAFAMKKEDRARAIQQQQAKREQEARGQQALLEYLEGLEAGTATGADLRRAMVENPLIAERFQNIASSRSQEQLANDERYFKQIAFSVGRNNTDVARNLIQERVDAAIASGDEAGAAAYKSHLMQLDNSPETLLGTVLSPLAATMKPDDFDKFHDSIFGGKAPAPTEAFRTTDAQLRAAGIFPIAEGGDGRYEESMAGKAGLGDETQKPFSKIGQLKADLNAGIITQEEFDLELKRLAPSGMSIQTLPDGTIRFVQGPGVGAANTGKRSTDFVYTTNDEGQPVARPIAGTPAAAETEAQRGTLNASISVGRDMLKTIESIVGRPAGDGQTAVKPDPALAGMLGLIEGRLPPRTQAQADLAAKMEQVSGRAFLEAFETLKGAGQITEVEGVKATQALARLQRTQSLEAYQEALYEFADIVRRGIARSMNELNVLPEVAPAPKGSQADTGQSTGGRVRYDADGNRIQ